MEEMRVYGRCDALSVGLEEAYLDCVPAGSHAEVSVYEVDIALERSCDPSYTELVKATCPEEAALIVIDGLQRRKAFGVDDDDSVTITVM